MPKDDDIAFTLVVDYFRPDGTWYETVSTDVTFVEVPTFNLEDDFCNLFFEKTGRLVPHPEFTSFIRIENQHPEDHNFCRYLIQPLTNSFLF